MDDLLDKRQGTMIVKKARATLAEHLGLKSEEIVLEDDLFEENRGIFVTLSTYPAHDLRGCIGFVQGLKPLKEAVREASIHAGLHDSRFDPVSADQLDKIIFEVSVLTPPKEIKSMDPDDLLEKIKIGRDGLIIEYGGSLGLLLPQVPIEWNWSKTEFLEGLCNKAGLPRDMWRSRNITLKRFNAQIFCEDIPNGDVSEKKLVR